MKNILTIILVLLSFNCLLLAQDGDYQIGLNSNYSSQNQGAFYDYSDPDGINIKVSVWGYVKFPGKYVIPIKSDIKDLISYAGGINDNAYLDDLRIYRINKSDSSQVLLKFNYNDLWWGENLRKDLDIARLVPGDVLIVRGRPHLYWENYLSLSLSALGLLVSIATLIITSSR